MRKLLLGAALWLAVGGPALAATITFIDAADGETTTVYEGDLVRVRVVDPDADASPDPDTVVVVASSQVTADAEPVTLTETGGGTGTFEGSIQLVSNSPPTSLPGELETWDFSPSGEPVADVVHAEHQGGSGPVQASAQVRLSRTLFVDEHGLPITSGVVGGRLRLRIVDEHSGEPGFLGLLQVTLSALPGDDVETVQLVEVESGTGVFEGSISTARGPAASGDRVLQAEAGEVVTFTSSEPNGLPVETSITMASSSIELFGGEGDDGATFVEGTSLRVRVVDHYADIWSFRRHTVYAQVTSSYAESLFSADRETVVLIETDRDSNVYEGWLRLDLGPKALENGALTTGRHPDFPEQGDELAASYTSTAGVPTVTAAGRTTGPVVTLTDERGGEAAAYAAGSRLRVRLQGGPAGDSLALATATVTVRAVAGGDEETLTLVETDRDSEVYEGTLPLTTAGGSAGDGELSAAIGDAVEVRRDHAVGGTSSVDMVPIVGGVFELVDEAGRPTAVLLEEGEARIRLVQPISILSGSVETVLSAALSGDQEQPFLAQEGGGVFSTAVPLTAAAGEPGDGALTIGEFPEFSFHLDTVTAGCFASESCLPATATTVTGIARFVDERGDDATTSPAGAPLRLVVGEARADVSSAEDSVTLTIQSLLTGDLEVLTLQETGPSTGVFTGSLPTGNDSEPVDGLLGVAPGELVLAIASGFFASYDLLTISAAAIELVDGALQPVETYLDGGFVTIRAIDEAANLDPFAADVIVVEVLSTIAHDTNGDLEPVLLFETGPDTGELVGGIGLEFGATGTEDGILQIFGREPRWEPDTITVSHLDAIDTALVVGSTVRFVDVEGADVEAIGLGEELTVEVEDVIRAESEPAVVELRAIEGGDVETLVLPETGSFAVFRASILTATGPATPDDGILQAPRSTAIVARHVHANTPGFASDQVAADAGGAPLAVPDAATTEEDTVVEIDVLANDSDPDGALAIVAVGDPGNGVTAIASATTVLYAPTPDFHGTDTFTYTVQDPGGATSTAVVTVTVTPVNDPPAAVDDAETLFEDTGILAFVLVNDGDVEGDALTVVGVTQPANGVVTIAIDGSGVDYVPDQDFHGADGFTYTVQDAGGAVDTATVAVSVTPLDDAPVADDDAASTPEDAAVTIAVLANDTDPDGDALAVQSVTQPASGSVAINPDGTVTYTPAPNANGVVTFSCTARDSGGLTDTATVTVTVAPVNDPPVAAADATTTREDVPVAIPVLANDSDIEGSALGVAGVADPANGTAAIAGTQVTYTPDPGFTGTDAFGYTVSDGQGGTANGTITVTVRHALEQVAVLATNSAWLQTGSDVLSGDVVVDQAGAGPFLNGGVELSIAGSATTPAGFDVAADSLLVAAGATVAGDAHYNGLSGTGPISGDQVTPLALPVFAGLPAFQTASPAGASVNVANNGTRTLAPGSHLDLVVGRRGTVTFTGGVYHFRSITVDREARLLFSAASEVRVQQKLSTKQSTVLQPAADAAIDASGIVLHVGGVNGTTGGLAATPKAVEIGTDNVVRANVYAPNGTLWLGDRTQATGAFVGRDVQVGVDAQVTLDSAWTGQ